MEAHALRCVRAGLLAAMILVGCAGAGLAPSESVTTAAQGWEHYFRLDWTSQGRLNGMEIDVYVYNLHGTAAGNVQILAQALDASNHVVAQELAWVHGVVPALNRSYFKVPGLPPAPQYRLTVWAFDIIDTPNSPRRRF